MRLIKSFGNLFSKRIKKTILPVFIIIITNILFALLYLITCNQTNDWKGMDSNVDTLNEKLFNRIYFSFSTTSTVGSGNIVPISFKARLIVMMHYLVVSSEILGFLTN